MAEKCRAFYGMKIIYHNRGRNQDAEERLGAIRVSFEELLSESDVLSVHASLSKETLGKFNYESFRKMKPASIILNTARGAIIEEKDLIRALKDGIIWGAGLDVSDPEPMHPDNPLLSMPSVAVTPHIGSATRETRDAMSVRAAENVIAALRGQRIPYPVNPEVYDH